MADKHGKSPTQIADAIAQMDVQTIAQLLQVGLSRGASANGLNPAQFTEDFCEAALDAQPQLIGVVSMEYGNQVATMFEAVNDWATKNALAAGKAAK